MTRRSYFGTDGIRGVAGQPPLTIGLVVRLGRALAALRPGTVVIGRDTRLSSPAIRDALSAGLLAGGADVVDLGVLPTPGVACEVLRRGASAGIVVTASHNPYTDNGIKVFAADGTKIDDEDELRLERDLETVDLDGPGEMGRWLEDAAGARQAYAESLTPAGRWGADLHLAVDAANGAASALAASVLEATGARVTPLFCDPDGTNINVDCGAVHPRHLCDRIASGQAQLGVALDGDADRCVLVGEDGSLVDGDVLIALLALHRGLDRVVGTVMTNEGVARHLRDRGVAVIRAAVGDRNVLLSMRARGALLGGESSGHVIQLDRSPTGDGLATALAALQLRHEAGRPLCELAAEIPRFPSALRAVRVREKVPLDQLPEMTAAAAAAEGELADRGRVLLRYSGTEPVLRVFVEGADEALVKALCDRMAETAHRLLGDEEE